MQKYLVLLLVLLGSNSLNPGNNIYVHFQQTGGFAGLSRSLEFSSDTLSVQEQKQLHKLIKDSDFFEIRIDNKENDKSRDQFQYEILIKQNDREGSISVSDSNMPESIRPLIDYLSRKVRTQR